jgi:hypothetical protein
VQFPAYHELRRQRTRARHELRRRYGIDQPKRLTRAIELTFLGDPLEGFFVAFDAVLMLVTIERKKLHDLISPIGTHVTERLRREIDRLTEPKLVCVQR